MHRNPTASFQRIFSPRYHTENTLKTLSVITSCRILSCGVDIVSEPSRFAGTWKQYSGSAINQLIRIAIGIVKVALCLRCPYQANVMNTLESVRRTMVFMGDRRELG